MATNQTIGAVMKRMVTFKKATSDTSKIDAAQAEMANMRRERRTVQRASATMAPTPSAAKTLLGQ